jgi:uncharacterized protein YhaN
VERWPGVAPEVFARQRRALPMILDDILGWTDDARFRHMINVLEHAARDLQVLVLSCHRTRFSRFSDAKVFTLEGRAPSVR